MQLSVWATIVGLALGPAVTAALITVFATRYKSGIEGAMSKQIEDHKTLLAKELENRRTELAEERARRERNEERQFEQANWPNMLARELERARGADRQVQRFASYRSLWSAMRPLSLYDGVAFNRSTMAELSTTLSAWYFSVDGGLMLTPYLRSMYFALQDLLHTAGAFEDDWQAQPTLTARVVFDAVLRDLRLSHAQQFMATLAEKDVYDRWPTDGLSAEAAGWSTDVAAILGHWRDLSPEQRFAVIQQVGSVLRTGLAADVQSRLR